jgi:hypothetical protein
MMDRPGALLDVDWIAGQIREPRLAEVRSSHRRTVSGSLSAIRGPATVSGRRLPFYWWAGDDEAGSQYAMKPGVARLFREARNTT